MSSPRSFLALTLRVIVPILILGGGVVASQFLASLRKPPVPMAREERLPLVRAVVARAYRDQPLEIAVDGTVIPFRRIQIATEVTGRVAYKSPRCRVGHYVQAGEELLRIDRRELELEKLRLEEEKKQAEFSLAEHRVELGNILEVIALQKRELALQESELNRLKSLQRSSAATASAVEAQEQKVLVSANSVLQSENKLRSLNSRTNTLQSAIDVVDQRLARAELDLDRSSILAPVSGVVTEEHVEEDSFVQRGTTLVSIEDTSRSEVICSLKMDDLYWLWQQPQSGEPDEQMALVYDIPDTPAEVVYELAGHQYSWKGTLTRYAGVGLDEKTRTVPCRVEVPDPHSFLADGKAADSVSAPKGPPALVRGMFVRVKVFARPQTLLLEVPEVAIRPGDVVWVVNSENRLERRPVRIARADGEKVILHGDESQLEVGERVVISPLATETTNTLVDVAEDSAESETASGPASTDTDSREQPTP